MHFSTILLLLLGISFCSKSDIFRSVFPDSMFPEFYENELEEEVQVPSEWTDFLNNMTGADDDSATLKVLLDNKTISPSAALLDIIRSEKCHNGLFDCSGLVDTCNDRGGFLTHETSMADIKCFFKFWVSHRDRDIRPCSRMDGNRTLYYLMNLFCQSNKGSNHFFDLELYELAQKYETRAATEEDMCEYFTIHTSLRDYKRHLVLAHILRNGLPLYPCMLKFALGLYTAHFDPLIHPRMIVDMIG